MSLLPKLGRPAAPTATDPVQPPVDEEKATRAADDDTSLPGGHHQVSPEIERRVVRKLDQRLVPLVAVLCTSSSDLKFN